jgi:hypothetical protein
MVAIDILLDMLMHKPSLSSLYVGLLGAWGARRTMITVTNVHLIIIRGSSFRVFALCMGVAIIPVIL